MNDPRTVLRREVIEAIIDYRYLLDRGYKSKGALDLITSRYLLSREERLLLYRCVHSGEDALKIISKKLESIRNQRLVIDGYNVLITIAASIEGRTLYYCDDGIVRDLRSARIKDFTSPSITKAMKELTTYLSMESPAEVILFLDKSVSKSAEHAAALRNQAPEWKVILASKADTQVLLTEGVTASSDYVILMNSRKIFDLAGKIVLKTRPNQVVNIKSLLNKT